MADLKISQLPSATTPLAGTEVLPIVQSSATKQVSIANLTAGRSVSVADATLTTGNLVIGTSGKGIDFSATGEAGGMTSELLDDYEIGTWTPNQGGGLTVVGAFSSGGAYTKVGRIVTVNFYFAGATSVAAAAGGNLCTNLPFTAFNASFHEPGTMVNNALSAGGFCAAERNTTNVWANSAMPATALISCSITYIV